ncbi:uncharacterized protein N7469_002071 [Penicillium citrinum]|uniref:Uncharacterized protein n=1 Tax=Penicillium citrinum TaxID=5077 RepID=A0A9W9P9Z5_PENCI|nr:uncharacterized protein N7469_002071 [Penicillium citrinum]KAJ5240480.1 hypothetical protein N7469_002071 [Penicillium citrinum]
MAKLTKCTERSITNIRKKMRLFSSPNPPESLPAQWYAVQTGHCKLIPRDPNTYLKSTVSQPYRCCAKPYTGSGL